MRCKFVYIFLLVLLIPRVLFVSCDDGVTLSDVIESGKNFLKALNFYLKGKIVPWLEKLGVPAQLTAGAIDVGGFLLLLMAVERYEGWLKLIAAVIFIWFVIGGIFYWRGIV